MTAIKLTPERVLSIHHRIGRAASFKFVFTEGGNPYDISALEFELFLKKFIALDGEKTMSLTNGNGLEIGGAGNNELTVTITEEAALTLEATRYHWQLLNLTSAQTWFNGPFICHNGEFDAGSVEDIDAQVDLGDVVVEVGITIAGGGGWKTSGITNLSGLVEIHCLDGNLFFRGSDGTNFFIGESGGSEFKTISLWANESILMDSFQIIFQSGITGYILSPLNAILKGPHSFTHPVKLKSYTVALVPSAADYKDSLIIVSNESGGLVPAFSDGTNWRRVTDRAIIS